LVKITAYTSAARDMNELYKEFYVLKKKVKAMAKKLEQSESLT